MQFNEVNVFPLPRGMDMVNLFFPQCIFENRYLEILYVNIHIWLRFRYKDKFILEIGQHNYETEFSAFRCNFFTQKATL